jgi:hypothetical protein
VLIGKLLIKNLQQKIMDQVVRIVHHIRIMVVQLLIVVVMGKYRILIKYYI